MFTSPFFGGEAGRQFKGNLRLEATQWTSMLGIQKKTRKKKYKVFFSPWYVASLSLASVVCLSFHTLFLSPGDYLQIVIVNKPLGSYEVHTISFQTFLVWAFKIVQESWKFSMLLLYILWDDWPIFMISASNQQLQQKLEYTLLKLDCHSCWFSRMQSGRKDTLEKRYAITFCFKLEENATETYGMLQTAFGASCMNWASVFEWHKRFKEARESVRDDERCGRSKEVNTPELIGQRVRVRVTMLRF